MKVLVTGGAGFIGSTLVHLLLHRAGAAAACCPDQGRYAGSRSEVEVVTVDALTYAGDLANLTGVLDDPRHRLVKADIADRDAMEEAFRDFRPEVVMHLAAESHVDRSIAGGEAFVRTNVLGTQILLDAARRHDVRRFVHVSTDEVYGSIDTGSTRPDSPYAPSSPYSASKAGSDLLALAHHYTYGTPVLVTRCTNNYGPRQHPEKLLPKTTMNLLSGARVPVYGDGLNVRDWLHVRDHANALLTILERGRIGQVHHIAGRDERRNLDLVRAVLHELGLPEDRIEFVRDRPGHDRRYSLDDHDVRALGWHPQTDFATGLRETIAWYRSEYPRLVSRPLAEAAA